MRTILMYGYICVLTSSSITIASKMTPLINYIKIKIFEMVFVFEFYKMHKTGIC